MKCPYCKYDDGMVWNERQEVWEEPDDGMRIEF